MLLRKDSMLPMVTIELGDGSIFHGVTLPAMLIKPGQTVVLTNPQQPDIPVGVATGPSTEAAPATQSSVGNSSLGEVPNPEQSKKLNAEGLHNLLQQQHGLYVAKEDFEQAVQLDPTNIEALNNLGYVYLS
jgi:hypothetical protein